MAHLFYCCKAAGSKRHSPRDRRGHFYTKFQNLLVSGPCVCIQSHPVITEWTPTQLSSQKAYLSPDCLRTLSSSGLAVTVTKF